MLPRSVPRPPRHFAAWLLFAVWSAGCGPGDSAPVRASNGAGTAHRPEAGAVAVEPAAHPFEAVVADYEASGDTLIVREATGRLEAVIQGDTYILREAGDEAFVLEGVRHRSGEEVRFRPDAAGQPDVAVLSGVSYQRILYGAEGGATFRIEPVRPVDVLRVEARAAAPPVEDGDFRDPDLVDLETLDPTIRFDIRYATTNNFMGAAFYEEPRAFLQRPAAEALLRAHQRLRGEGLGLMVFDAYRPWSVTWKFWRATPQAERQFVANPSFGSRHNRGAAVDVTLYDLATGEPVAMPSGYDEFSRRAHPDYPGGMSVERRNRDLLRAVMESEGFRVYHLEWWHFDHRDWRRYPILNLTFDQVDLAPGP